MFSFQLQFTKDGRSARQSDTCVVSATPSGLSTPVTTTYQGVLSGGSYTVRVTAVNEHGSSESVVSEEFVVTGVCVCVCVCVCVRVCVYVCDELLLIILILHYYFVYQTTSSIIKCNSNLIGDNYHNPGSHHCCTGLPPCDIHSVFNPGQCQIEKR